MNPRKIRLYLLILFGFLTVRTLVTAQARGPGTGALASSTNGTTLVTITNGRTAPWAEVIVETTGEEMAAVAEIDAGGLFSFTFYTTGGNIGNMVIYAVDEAGVTTEVPVTGTSFSDFILPPTIIGNTADLPDTSVGMEGFSYRGAVVTLTVTSDTGYNEVFSINADNITGKWSWRIDDLANGNYTAYATASIVSLNSLKSQDLTFTIAPLTPTPTPGLIPIPGGETVIKIITGTTETIVNLTTQIGEQATELISELPPTTKKNVDIVSKLLVPVAATSLIWSVGLLNFINFITALIRLILGFFVPKRKKNRWGVVYDAATKQPILRAIVRLYKKSGELVETEATGRTGIFSFFAEEGDYEIKVSHPDYTFPSKLVFGETDGEYQSIYHGGRITITKSSPIFNANIPLDPKGYEVVPRFNIYKDYFRKFAVYGNTALFVIGLVLSIIAYIITPIFYNLIILLLYAFTLIYLLYKIYKDQTSWGIVSDSGGKPTAGVSLSLLDSVFRRLVQRRVADRYGRYQFVVPEGGYIILITSPEWELTPHVNTYGGGQLNVKKGIGIIKPRIVVNKKGQWSFGS